MPGRLEQKHKKQLEHWIGSGQKDLQLLYSVRQTNGCNTRTFHQKCDNQGPTVTVLYNTNNSVFGGYTSQCWTSDGNYVKDDKAFLFQMHFNGRDCFKKFPVVIAQTAIYCDGDYGPTFGGNEVYAFFGRQALHTLETFTNDQVYVKQTFTNGQVYVRQKDVYRLNGYLQVNQSYEFQGTASEQINNGNMDVIDLEVYKVVDKQVNSTLLSLPWRKSLSWTKESLQQLILSIEKYEPSRATKIPETRILLVGPIGAGKSSFFNTINSIFKGRVTQRGYTGSAEHSLTTVYRQYQILSNTTGEKMKFRLCDTRGLEESEGLGLIEFSYLVEGNVPDWYQFNPVSPLNTETPGFIHIPKINDKVHCVSFIFDCSTVDVLPKNILDKIKEMQQWLIKRGVPQTIILTKVDKVSQLLDRDISMVFHCEEVQNVVDKVSQTLGVPRSNIFPLKNYENETQLDQNINILALQTLKQVLGFADDYLENYLEKMEYEKRAQMNIRQLQI